MGEGRGRKRGYEGCRSGRMETQVLRLLESVIDFYQLLSNSVFRDRQLVVIWIFEPRYPRATR